MELPDVTGLNLEASKPVTTEKDDVPERRMPMRLPQSCIQYWVNTGRPPCMACVDKDYNSSSETSLSESEISAVLPVESRTLQQNAPQSANIPREAVKSCSSVVSSSSVNTRDFILSSNKAKEQLCSPVMGNITSRKVVEAHLNSDDTYVDVCGTDEPPKAAQAVKQNIDHISVNSQNTTIIHQFAAIQDSPDKTVVAESLKIENAIPSLQCIRDNLEDCSVTDGNTVQLSTPHKLEESENKVTDFKRRRLFTNRNSPVELMKPLNNRCRSRLSNVNIHPALEAHDQSELKELKESNKRKLIARRKQSFSRKKLQLQNIKKDEQKKDGSIHVSNIDTRDEDLKKVEKFSDYDSNSKSKSKFETCKKDIPLQEKMKRRTVSQNMSRPRIDFNDADLEKKPVVRLIKLSSSLIQRYKQKNNNEDQNKSKSKKGTERKIKKDLAIHESKKDRETRAPCSKAVANEFSKNELNLRHLTISLQRIPIVVLTKIPEEMINAYQRRESVFKEASLGKVIYKATPFRALSSDLEKSSEMYESFEKLDKTIGTFVNSNRKEVAGQHTKSEHCKKSPAKKRTRTRSVTYSSDEDSFMDAIRKATNQKNLNKRTVARVERVKQNSIANDLKNERNIAKVNDTLELNNKSKSTKNPRKIMFTYSSDEEENFTKIMKTVEASRNNEMSSKNISDNNKTKNASEPGCSTNYKSSAVEKLRVNNLQTRNSDFNKNVTNKQLLDNFSNTSNTKTSDNTSNLNMNKSHLDFQDTRRMSRFVIVSSEDSDDSAVKINVSSKSKQSKKESSRKKSSKSEKKFSRSRRNLNSRKSVTQRLNSSNSEEDNSNLKINNTTSFQTRVNSFAESKSRNVDVNRIETNNDKEIEPSKKLGSSVFLDFDSTSSPELNVLIKKKKFSRPSKLELTRTDEINEGKHSSRMESLPAKRFVRTKLQTAMGVAESTKRLNIKQKSTLNKRKKPRFGGSVSSDTEESQSDIEFTSRSPLKRVKTCQDDKTVSNLQSKSGRKETRNPVRNFSSKRNLFIDDSSRDSSLNIFNSPHISSDNENILEVKFRSNFQNKETNRNSVKDGNSWKVIYRTRSVGESDSD